MNTGTQLCVCRWDFRHRVAIQSISNLHIQSIYPIYISNLYPIMSGTHHRRSPLSSSSSTRFVHHHLPKEGRIFVRGRCKNNTAPTPHTQPSKHPITPTIHQTQSEETSKTAPPAPPRPRLPMTATSTVLASTASQKSTATAAKERGAAPKTISRKPNVPELWRNDMNVMNDMNHVL